MQEYMKKRDHMVIPSFGNWDSFDELEITQYFESARQAGFLRGHSFRNVEADMYIVVPPSPLPSYYHNQKSRRQQHRHGRVKPQRKQGRVFNEPIYPPRRNRAPRAVDEDLYEIPSDLIHHKTKKMVLTDLWKRCMRLNCVP